MNRTVFALRGDEAVTTALDYFTALGIGCAPVVSPRGMPVGVVGWRDLLSNRESTVVSQCMVQPARCIRIDAPISEAADALDRHNLHHLVVVDATGRLAGFVSGLDVVRGLSGKAPRHPDLFPQFHGDTSLAWSSERELTPATAAEVDAVPGLVAVLTGALADTPRVVLSEAVSNLQQRLLEVVARTVDLPGQLRDAPAEQALWFRVAPFGSKTIIARGGGAATLADLIRVSGRDSFVVGPAPDHESLGNDEEEPGDAE